MPKRRRSAFDLFVEPADEPASASQVVAARQAFAVNVDAALAAVGSRVEESPGTAIVVRHRVEESPGTAVVVRQAVTQTRRRMSAALQCNLQLRLSVFICFVCISCCRVFVLIVLYVVIICINCLHLFQLFLKVIAWAIGATQPFTLMLKTC